MSTSSATPTTRLIGKQPGIDVDLDEAFAAYAHTGTALEMNARPDRLDLSDEDVLRAGSHGRGSPSAPTPAPSPGPPTSATASARHNGTGSPRTT